MADSTKQRRTRLPPRRGSAVVHIGHLARTLGRPTAWLRRLDDLLQPVVLANGQRVYHLDRAWTYDGPSTCLPAFEAYGRECDERASRRT